MMKKQENDEAEFLVEIFRKEIDFLPFNSAN